MAAGASNALVCARIAEIENHSIHPCLARPSRPFPADAQSHCRRSPR